jgi:hypothetical protein
MFMCLPVVGCSMLTNTATKELNRHNHLHHLRKRWASVVPADQKLHIAFCTVACRPKLFSIRCFIGRWQHEILVVFECILGSCSNLAVLVFPSISCSGLCVSDI